MKIKSNCSLALLMPASLFLVNASPLRASETDDRIEASAKNSYVFKTYLKDDAVKTESKDGVVTLTGSVAEAFHKSLAQDTVAGLPAVKRVDNQLKINAEGPAEHSDNWLGLKVKTALLFHRNVSASHTVVSVDDGTVSLSGEAASEAQKDLTTEYAKDVDGVKGVTNQMTVASKPAKPVETIAETIAERIDDASISAQIRASLMVHRSTSALMTKIETTEGVVTVGGTAKNAAEKSLVTKLVSDIHGVRRVINQMSIATGSVTKN